MTNSIDITSTKNFLDKVGLIIKKQEEIATKTGDDFNIFRILGVNFKETSYSRIIAGLINPKGLHRQDNLYLNLFLDEIVNQIKSETIELNNEDQVNKIIIDIESLKNLNTIVKREFHLGKVDNKNETGGFIDILIKNNNFSIAIENKIDAFDQKKQLVRYKKNSNIVLYLTKNGTAPSKESAGSLIENQDYFCISYSDTVKKWIEKSIHASINLPKIRETLQQFHNSINIITMQTDNKLNDELKQEIKKNKESLNSFLYLVRFGKSIKINILAQLIEQIIGNIKSEFNFVNINNNFNRETYKFIGFKNDELDKLGIELTFSFNTKQDDYSKLIVGYKWIEVKNKNLNTIERLELLKESLSINKVNIKSSDHYPLYFNLPEYGEISILNNKFEDLINEDFEKNIQKYIKELFEVLMAELKNNRII
jgi:hypothetical protein